MKRLARAPPPPYYLVLPSCYRWSGRVLAYCCMYALLLLLLLLLLLVAPHLDMYMMTGSDQYTARPPLHRATSSCSAAWPLWPLWPWSSTHYQIYRDPPS